MSRIPLTAEEEDSKKAMAVTYTSAPVPVDTPTLPSIRELLPEHIHGRRDLVPPRLHYHAQSSSSMPHHEWTTRSNLMSRSGNTSNSSSPPRISGPSEAAPRSILNDPVQHHGSLGPQQQQQPPPRHSLIPPSTTHYPSSHSGAEESKRILPPIRDLEPRSDELRSYPFAYEQKSIHEVRNSMNQPVHMVPSASTPVSPLTAHTPPQQLSTANSQYGLYQQPFAAELDYPSPHTVKPHNSPNRSAMSDAGSESRQKKRRGNLPKPVTDILRAWFHEHLDHPYPSEEDKQMFMTRTGLTISQISNWFINARRRQLPALRDRARAAESEKNGRQDSPSSDEDQVFGQPPDSTPPNS
ncbi:hypothetical protein VTO42DRAFT_401 [Malbranchea cinnamomea]